MDQAKRLLRRLAGILAVLLWLASWRATPAAEAESDPPSAAASARALENLAAERDAIRKHIASLEEAEAEKSDEAQADHLNLLRSTDALYAQHQTRLQELQDLAQQRARAEQDLKAAERFDPNEPKPYSFLLLDKLKDSLKLEVEREKATKADLRSARQLLRAAHEELDEAEAERRKAEPSAESESQAAKLADDQVAHAKAKVAQRQTAVEVQEQKSEVSKLRQQQFEKKIETIEDDTEFSDKDREKQLGILAGRQADLKQQKRRAESELQQADHDERSALKELAQEEGSDAGKAAITQAYRTARNMDQASSVLLDQMLENLTKVREVWQRRYKVAADEVGSSRAATWIDELDGLEEQLQETTHSLEQQRDAARDEQSALFRGGDRDDKAVEQWREFESKEYQSFRDLAAQDLESIKSDQRMLERYRDELKPLIKAPDTSWNLFSTPVKKVLGMEVDKENEKEEVTVGQFLLLLMGLVLGVMLAYSVSRFIGGRLLARFGFQPGSIAAVKSIVFYILIVVFGFMAFQLLHVPLTAFAFLGGAAAIAVGFGSTDIMNNFMSGIILLTEQPIRVGDYVKLDSVQGTVVHMGLRSTRMRTDANYEVTVPNKTLLAGTLTNLTLSDTLVQMTAKVSIDRDVLAVDAKREMLTIAFKHPQVLKSPRPTVVLKEFDPYWSTFEIYFWVQHVNYIRSAVVQSEIMEAICDRYRPKGEDAASSETPAPEPEANGASPNGAEATNETNGSSHSTPPLPVSS